MEKIPPGERRVGERVFRDANEGRRGMNLFDLVLSRGRRMVAIPGGEVAARLVGIKVGDMARDPGLQAEAMRSLKDRFRPDIIFSLLDPTVEAEAIGLEVNFHPDRPPDLQEQELARLKLFLQLEPPDPDSGGRMPVYLRALEELAGEEGVLWGAFCCGPLTFVSQLAGGKGWSEQVGMEADLKEALGFATAVIGSYASALGSRADLLAVVDPVAGELPERTFSRLYRPFLKALFGIVRSAGAACLYHVCGDSSRLLTEVGISGADGLLLDPEMEPASAVGILPRNMVLLGNLDGERTLRRGSEDEVRWEVRRTLRSMRSYPNFILSPGCRLPVDTPPENIDVLVEETHNWRPVDGF